MNIPLLSDFDRNARTAAAATTFRATPDIVATWEKNLEAARAAEDETERLGGTSALAKAVLQNQVDARAEYEKAMAPAVAAISAWQRVNADLATARDVASRGSLDRKEAIRQRDDVFTLDAAWAHWAVVVPGLIAAVQACNSRLSSVRHGLDRQVLAEVRALGDRAVNATPDGRVGLLNDARKAGAAAQPDAGPWWDLLVPIVLKECEPKIAARKAAAKRSGGFETPSGFVKDASIVLSWIPDVADVQRVFDAHAEGRRSATTARREAFERSRAEFEGTAP